MKPIKKFKLIRKFEDIQVEGADGIEQALRVYEMTGTLRESYMDDMRNRMEFDKDGKPTGKLLSTAGMQSKLLELCLVTRAVDGTETRIPSATIAEWPGGVVQEIFTLAQSINGLGDEQAKTEESLKNA
jgi:hypothetical protein